MYLLPQTIQKIQDYFDDIIKTNKDKALLAIKKEAFTLFRDSIAKKNGDHQHKKIYDLLNHNGFNTVPNVIQHIQPNLFNNIDETYTITISNGIFQKKNSYIPSNISIQVYDAKVTVPQKILFFFKYFLQKKTNIFYLLNTALCQKGIFINIPNHIILDKPLFIKYQNDDQKHTLFSYKTFIHIGKGSKVTFLASNLHQPPYKVFNLATDINIEANSCMHYYNLQNRIGEYTIHNVNSKLDKKSTFNTYTFSFSGNYIQNYLNIFLNGENASTNMYGTYILSKEENVSNTTMVKHLKPNTQSNELYQGILFDNAWSKFCGKIHVEDIAQKTKAYQSNHNLVLSDKAIMLTQPQLVIFADDVKCSHGATIGKIDPEQLFYLQARGIQKNIARNILLQAFIQNIVDKIPNEMIKKWILYWSKQKMEIQP